MFPYPILSDNSEAQHSSISIYIPSAGRSFMLEFLCWSSKDIWFGAFQFALACSVICCSDFVIQERSFLIWGRSEFVRRSWIMIPICWMLFGIMEDFFKQPLASVQIMAVLSFELFGFFWFLRRILFTSVRLYYFDLKSDWLPLLTFAFGSPPEVLLFRYLLFVTIR